MVREREGKKEKKCENHNKLISYCTFSNGDEIHWNWNWNDDVAVIWIWNETLNWQKDIFSMS